jgi:phage shock protein E
MNKLWNLAFAVMAMTVLPLGGCTVQKSSAAYQKLSYEEAKSIIDGEDGIVILDVRTLREFDEGHIENAVLIPDTELEDRVEDELPDKDAKILIYCRTGRRSANSARLLIEMGYTKVYDFGGIVGWPYDIVK